MKIILVCALLAASLMGCRTGNDSSSLERFGGHDPNKPNNGNHGGLLPCTGKEPPRQGAPYVIDKPAGKAKIAKYQKDLDDWKVEMEKFEKQHPGFEAELEDLKVKYDEIAKVDCLDNAQCNKYDPKITGGCYRYVWENTNGVCKVSISSTLTPPEGPVSPNFGCADVTCPSNTKCEEEPHSGQAGCVEPKNCL